MSEVIERREIKGIFRKMDGNATIKFESKEGDAVEVLETAKFMRKNKPQVGGFYLKFEDGTNGFELATLKVDAKEIQVKKEEVVTGKPAEAKKPKIKK